jgi:hypothetical protein
MVFNEPAQEAGKEFVPPEGTRPTLMNKLAMGILAKLYETGSKYEGNLD